jgi:CRISPR/Cas system-associated exonuclease Cas4 (RecB family)
MPNRKLNSELQGSFTFSQSSLQDYSDCARRFQLRYIEQLQWPAVESEPVVENERRRLEGQFFHRMLQQHLIGLPAEVLAPLANTPNLSRWWGNYLNHHPDLSGLSLHPELSLSAPVDRHRLLAKYDLVGVKPGEKAIVVDWKTYARRPRNEWLATRLQTKVYRALLVQAGGHLNSDQPFRPEQVEMVYWFADFPTEPARFPYDSAQYKRDWDGLVKLIKSIQSERAFPMTGEIRKCGYCPYRSYCDRGRTAGVLEEMDVESELGNVDVSLEQVQEIEF